MLYVYHVDTGTMLTFDMNLAMESVSKLQEVIAKTCRISEDKQVLLISGGENLDPNARVCSYSAGTDTNPIFLFSKSTIEAATPPSASVNYGSEADLKEQVEGALSMPSTYDTVVVRTQLALQFHDVAKEELRICERLVHDQHLQHQGWAAVIANLEDITSAFRSRAEVFNKNVEDYIQARENHIAMLSRFPSQVQLLSRIPVLPCLLEELTGRDAGEEIDSWSLDSRPKTLLEWISAQDSRNTLDQMAQQCQSGIEQFDVKLQDDLIQEVQKVAESTDNPSMKEVKGLEDRLSGLEQLMFGARKLVQEQGDMAQGFVQNQNRARTLSDPSVLPDLCNVHRGQLFAMLKNHQSMRDIRRRCTLAKEELSVNLHTRLRWVMYVEKSICDVDSKLVIHHETLKKLKRKLEIIHQMANAPEVYCCAIVEVVRRKMFSSKFFEWAGCIAEEAGQHHETEAEKRGEFLSQLKHHFLRSLFPGFEDTPPPFANKVPERFDDLLPPVTADDIEYLKTEVPELADRLRIPEESGPSVSKESSTMTLRTVSSLTPGGRREMFLSPLTDIVSSDIVVLNHSDHSDGEDQTYFSSGRELGDTSHSVEVLVQEDSSGDLHLSEHDSPSASRAHDSSSASRAHDSPSASRAHDSPSASRATAVGKLDTKRDTCHTVESPEGGPPSKIEKRDSHSLVASSPEVEEDSPSGGFTTADFYIDESMPSSMTESAPTKKIAELQTVVQEKLALLESKDKEIEDLRKIIQDLRPKLAQSEESFERLHDVTEKSALQFRCDLLSLSSSFQRERDDFQTFTNTVSQKLRETISRFEEDQIQFRDETITQLTQEHDTASRKLKHQLEVETDKVNDAHHEIEIYQKKVDEKCVALDSMKEEYETKLQKFHKEQEEMVQKEKNQLMLEHEIELEKVHSDLECEVAKAEKDNSELSTSLSCLKKELEHAVKEKELLEGKLREEYQQEKDQVLKIIEKDFNEKRQKYEAQLKETLETENQAKLAELAKDCKTKMEESFGVCKAELEIQQSLHITELEKNLKKQNELALQKATKESETVKKLALEELGKEMSAKHQDVIRELKAGLEAEKQEYQTKHQQEVVQSSATESESDGFSQQKHLEVLAEMKASHEDEKAKAVNEAVELERSRHQAVLEELSQKVEMDKHSLRTSMVAEKQVVFNEALNKVVEEKDKIIEKLKEKIDDLLKEKEEDKELICTLQSSEGATAFSRDHDREARMIQRRLEEELGVSKQQILQLQSQLHQQGGQGYVDPTGQSIMGLPDLPAPDPSLITRMKDLETTLKSKEDEMNKLQQKVMEMSMSTSSRMIVQDKVSITTCNTGDIVLLCLDERHDHYVVFTVGTTLHFLHSDCLEPLGLKTSPGEARKSWVLAEITDKEYCQAKKAQNRFRVPIGTKFYRVKAKPWNHGEVQIISHQALEQEAAASPELASHNR